MPRIKAYVDDMTGKGPFYADPDQVRDNILFISLDMVPREFYGIVDNWIEMCTPHLNALKREHLFFANAFCTSPLCTPSRAAYLSGRHSYITVNGERAHDGQAVHVRPEDILFPEYLKRVGYYTRHVGKCHVGAHKFIDIFGENDAPWDRWSPPWYDDEGYLTFLKQQGLGRLTFDRSIYGQDPAGQGTGNFYGGWLTAQQGRPFPKAAIYPAYLVAKAIETLETRRDPEHPFYLQLDFFEPHQPFAIPAGMEAREQELQQTIRLPTSYIDILNHDFHAPWPEPRVYRMYRKNWGLTNPEVLKDYLVANILQFELLDELIGDLLTYLRKQQMYDQTWIFLIADHGEMNGEMALIDKGAYLNPAVIRAPLLLKPPAANPLGRMARVVNTPVSLLDLAPTILDIAGIDTDARLDGVSLFATLQHNTRPADQPIVFEVWSHVVPNPAIGMVFTAADGEPYLFSFNTVDDIDELYHLDRQQRLNNLIADVSKAALLQEAVATLDAILERDRRWLSYSGFFKLKYAEQLGKPGGDRQSFF